MKDKIYIDGGFDDDWYENKISGKPKIKLPSVKVCEHHKPSKLGYIKWHEWADEMEKKGIKQTKCQVCKHWFFPEENP